jgi:hypothetical protein
MPREQFDSEYKEEKKRADAPKKLPEKKKLKRDIFHGNSICQHFIMIKLTFILSSFCIYFKGTTKSPIPNFPADLNVIAWT